MSTFDVVVTGGGPAGMMAAARAAQYGARTLLLEKNRELGRKLMITGRGRCNFAHDQEDPELLSKDYRHGGEFLLPALRKFGVKETAAFFLRRGIVASRERGSRLYPREGQDASSIVNALWTALKDGSVHVLRGMEVRSLDISGGRVRRVTTSREEIEGGAFILATGGLSFPQTGSTGDGYRWARKAGHKIIETVPALCPIKIAERFGKQLSGLKLKNVRVTVCQNGQTAGERFGEMDFTPFGISGAIIMDLASSVGSCLQKPGQTTIHINLKPALEPERLDARIERDFQEFSGEALRFALRKMLPGEIIPEVLTMARLDMGKPCGETTPEERAALRNTISDFTVTPTELLGFRHAIITSGGVSTDEIDPETMASKIVPNLYFAGEMIDADGPTGGYNLQECWSTGFAAGSAAAEALGFKKPTDQGIVRQMETARSRRDKILRAERQKLKEEKTEDMTIKTGPTDDKEFCGWRDPRRQPSPERTEETANSLQRSGQRPLKQTGRSRETHYEKKNWEERRHFAGRQNFHERRCYGEERPFQRERRPSPSSFSGPRPFRRYDGARYDEADRERTHDLERRVFDRPYYPADRAGHRDFERPAREDRYRGKDAYQRRPDAFPREQRPNSKEQSPRFSNLRCPSAPDSKERKTPYGRPFTEGRREDSLFRWGRPYAGRPQRDGRNFRDSEQAHQERSSAGRPPFDEDRPRKRDFHRESPAPHKELSVSKPRSRKFASFSHFRKDGEQ